MIQSVHNARLDVERSQLSSTCESRCLGGRVDPGQVVGAISRAKRSRNSLYLRNAALINGEAVAPAWDQLAREIERCTHAWTGA